MESNFKGDLTPVSKKDCVAFILVFSFKYFVPAVLLKDFFILSGRVAKLCLLQSSDVLQNVDCFPESSFHKEGYKLYFR